MFVKGPAAVGAGEAHAAEMNAGAFLRILHLHLMSEKEWRQTLIVENYEKSNNTTSVINCINYLVLTSLFTIRVLC